MKKICSKCQAEKELEENFDKKGTRYSSYCKICRKEYVNNHYQKNKGYYLQKAKKLTEETKGWLTLYKESLSCLDCSLSFKGKSYLCDFHHLRDKDFAIAELVSYGKQKVLEEIAKCIPLCANCHRERHYGDIAKLDTASEYESEDSESSNLSIPTD